MINFTFPDAETLEISLSLGQNVTKYIFDKIEENYTRVKHIFSEKINTFFFIKHERILPLLAEKW